MTVTTENFKSILTTDEIINQLQKSAIQIEFSPETIPLKTLINYTFADNMIIPYLISDDDYNSTIKDLLLKCELEIETNGGLDNILNYIKNNSTLVKEQTNNQYDTTTPTKSIFELISKYQLTKICVVAYENKNDLI